MISSLLAVLAIAASLELRDYSAIGSGGTGGVPAMSAVSASKPAGSPLDSSTQRARAMEGWTIAIPSEFEQIDNGDSWQAHKGDRTVYVSSLSVKDAHGKATPAQVLCATAAGQLGKSAGERLSFSEKNLRGEAEIIRTGDHWQLKGFMCAEGTLATCVIDYPDEPQKKWAVSTWRSLEHP